jgi:hypothetical protein
MALALTGGTNRAQRSSYDVDLSAAGSVSIAYWPTVAGNDNADHLLFQFYDGTNTFYCVKGADNKFYVDWFSPGRTVFLSVVFGSYSWRQNEWNLLAIAWDGSSFEARTKDSVSEFTLGPAGAPDGTFDTSVSTDFAIGGGPNGGGAGFVGRLAQMWIWNTFYPTATIVEAIWNGGPPEDLAPSAAVDGWPLGAHSLTESLTDGQRVLTITGATAVESEPPSSLFASSMYPISIAVVRRGGLIPAFLGPIPGFGAG